MRSTYLHLLQQEVEKTFGRKIISYADCLQLSDVVHAKTGERLSLNTLRRTFNLIKTAYPPSQNTITILSRYCSFYSFEELIQKRSKAEAGPGEKESLLKYLVSLFEQTKVSDTNDATYMDVVRQTIQFLEKEQGLIDSFQRRIAHTQNGQKFYFEQFVHIDKLAAFYGDGLHYYLSEKREKEAQIFGHSLLCLRYWLTGEPHLFDRHYAEVMRCTPEASMHPFVCGRYFAAQLLHAELKGLNPETIIYEARRFYADIKSIGDNYLSFPCFEIIMGEALLLINEWTEALYYINRGIKKDVKNKPAYVDACLFNGLYLFKATAYAGLGRTGKATEIFEKINVNSFYFLSKQYHTILYLLTGVQLKKIRVFEEQLAHLLSETGFQRLHWFNREKKEKRTADLIA